MIWTYHCDNLLQSGFGVTTPIQDITVTSNTGCALFTPNSPLDIPGSAQWFTFICMQPQDNPPTPFPNRWRFWILFIFLPFSAVLIKRPLPVLCMPFLPYLLIRIGVQQSVAEVHNGVRRPGHYFTCQLLHNQRACAAARHVVGKSQLGET